MARVAATEVDVPPPLHRLLLLALLATATASRAMVADGDVETGPPPIGHVFVIVLENKSFEATFGPDTPAPFLARTLPAKGVLLTQYFGTSHFSLGNYLAMISGQSATPETRDDCEIFADFVSSGMTSDGQAIGRGCVYPAAVRTFPDQLDALHKTWRGYMEDMGNDPQRETASCAHPPLNAPDPTQAAEAPSPRVPEGDQYAVRHNPFVYFHSIIDSPKCATNVISLRHLHRALAATDTTPNFVFVTPNLCNDGHDAPCKNGAPGGLASADAFLRTWVPRILASPAYRRDGLIVITFDEGDAADGAGSDGQAMTYAGTTCCDQQPGPNLEPFPQTERDGEGTVTFGDFGGDRVGAVLLSPFLRAGAVSRTPFNHYSLLKTLEDIFATPEHLGYAHQSGLVGFFETGSDIPIVARRPKH